MKEVAGVLAGLLVWGLGWFLAISIGRWAIVSGETDDVFNPKWWQFPLYMAVVMGACLPLIFFSGAAAIWLADKIGGIL